LNLVTKLQRSYYFIQYSRIKKKLICIFHKCDILLHLQRTVQKFPVWQHQHVMVSHLGMARQCGTCEHAYSAAQEKCKFHVDGSEDSNHVYTYSLQCNASVITYCKYAWEPMLICMEKGR
jgi:hypothetical protein